MVKHMPPLLSCLWRPAFAGPLPASDREPSMQKRSDCDALVKAKPGESFKKSFPVERCLSRRSAAASHVLHRKSSRRCPFWIQDLYRIG